VIERPAPSALSVAGTIVWLRRTGWPIRRDGDPLGVGRGVHLAPVLEAHEVQIEPLATPFAVGLALPTDEANPVGCLVVAVDAGGGPPLEGEGVTDSSAREADRWRVWTVSQRGQW